MLVLVCGFGVASRAFDFCFDFVLSFVGSNLLFFAFRFGLGSLIFREPGAKILVLVCWFGVASYVFGSCFGFVLQFVGLLLLLRSFSVLPRTLDISRSLKRNCWF